ncbi:hypothetical protein [uncultured Robinsoniella sp.]|uniref:hypothetical protein n=2 Tax=uncultured Robinsoniella sp. TaxID=904190 RepID=UPI00374F6EFB
MDYKNNVQIIHTTVQHCAFSSVWLFVIMNALYDIHIFKTNKRRRMAMGRFGKRFTAGILTGVLALLTPFSPLSGVMEVYAEQSAEEDWVGFQERLKSYGGTWNSPEYKEAVNDNMPQTALQGNGDTGIVSYGNAKEKTYLISKGDFRNGGDLVTSAPFSENDRSIRQIALGGVTIKKDSDKNKSLTIPDVTVKASSTHDTFVINRKVACRCTQQTPR